MALKLGRKFALYDANSAMRVSPMFCIAGTMTDITHDTWMLSGSTVMQDGLTLRNGYACDLDTLTAGTKIGETLMLRS